MKIAVHILNYNGEGWIKDCLESVKNQTDKDFDTYFIDGASSDNSVKIAQEIIPDIKIIQVGDNLGYTAGSNYGFKYLDDRKMDYDYYLMLGNDAICEKNLMEKLKKFIQDYKDKENLAILCPTIVSKEMKIDLVGGMLSLFTGRSNGNKHGLKYVKDKSVYKTFWGCTCCALINKKMLESVDYYDNDYYGYFDDVSMCWKFFNKGWDCVSLGDVYAIHLGSMSFKSTPLKVKLLERNRIYTYWQNMSNPFFALVMPLVLFTRILVLPIHFVTGVFSLEHIKNGYLGIIEGLRTFKKFKKYNYSISKDIRLLLNSNKVIKIEI